MAFRTEKVNSIFVAIAGVVSITKGNEKGTNQSVDDLSPKAERKGFEPSIRCRIHTFQACSFNHSDTSLFIKSPLYTKLFGTPLIPPLRKTALYNLSHIFIPFVNETPAILSLQKQTPILSRQKYSFKNYTPNIFSAFTVVILSTSCMDKSFTSAIFSTMYFK
jgi:hypothetical protein